MDKDALGFAALLGSADKPSAAQESHHGADDFAIGPIRTKKTGRAAVMAAPEDLP